MEFFFYVCSLPASACSAAAKTTSTEAAKTASATKTSATAKASAAEATSHGNPDGLVTSAGIVLVAIAGTENEDEGDDDKKDEPNGYAFAVIVVFVLGELARTEVHDDIDGVINALIVVVFLESGNHLLLDDVFGRGVGDILLHAVAGTDVDLPAFAAFLRLDKNDRAVVLALLSHTPTVADFSGILLDAVALQVVHEEDKDLRGRAVVVSHELPLQGVDL